MNQSDEASESENTDSSHRIDRLLDAIELVEADRRDEAQTLLRELIREDGNFESAWLWMSVAVDTLDQSTVCLDNVLRVNPKNHQAAGALYRIREPEILMQRRRGRMVLYRDTAFVVMWVFILVLLPVMTFIILYGE
ncbi:MAG: hypothetical protein AAF125_14835 [Chloroflexota bacterium]